MFCYIRAKLDEVNSENSALKDRLAMLQQEVKTLEEEVDKKRYVSILLCQGIVDALIYLCDIACNMFMHLLSDVARRRLEEMEREHERKREEEEKLHKEVNVVYYVELGNVTSRC